MNQSPTNVDLNLLHTDYTMKNEYQIKILFTITLIRFMEMSITNSLKNQHSVIPVRNSNGINMVGFGEIKCRTTHQFFFSSKTGITKFYLKH